MRSGESFVKLYPRFASRSANASGFEDGQVDARISHSDRYHACRGSGASICSLLPYFCRRRARTRCGPEAPVRLGDRRQAPESESAGGVACSIMRMVFVLNAVRASMPNHEGSACAAKEPMAPHWEFAFGRTGRRSSSTSSSRPSPVSPVRLATRPCMPPVTAPMRRATSARSLSNQSSGAGMALQLLAEKRADTAPASLNAAFLPRLRIEHEHVGQEIAQMGRIDVAARRRGPLPAQPVPMGKSLLVVASLNAYSLRASFL